MWDLALAVGDDDDDEQYNHGVWWRLLNRWWWRWRWCRWWWCWWWGGFENAVVRWLCEGHSPSLTVDHRPILLVNTSDQRWWWWWWWWRQHYCDVDSDGDGDGDGNAAMVMVMASSRLNLARCQFYPQRWHGRQLLLRDIWISITISLLFWWTYSFDGGKMSVKWF